jgi:DNA-nicking Smr family endonuclease
MSPRRHRHPTAEELKLWRDAMRDAVPLDPVTPQAADPVKAEPQAAPSPPLSPAPSQPQPPSIQFAAPPPRRETMAGLVPADLPGFDRRTSDRLRKGRIGIQARIDLHGMTQTEAHGALAAFVLRCWSDGCRSMLVITGKGSSGQGGGVLRRAVPLWLNQPPLRERIIGIEEAGHKDGGAGALYVLLRRRRDHGP